MGDKIVSPHEIISQTECERNRDQCFKINIKPIMEKLDKLDEKVDSVVLDLAKLPEKLIEKLDARYADKKTENNVDRLMWLVVSAVVIAILSLVLKN